MGLCKSFCSREDRLQNVIVNGYRPFLGWVRIYSPGLLGIMSMLLVQGLAFALALAGFLAATAVENRFQNYLRPSWEPPPVKPVAVPLAAE